MTYTTVDASKELPTENGKYIVFTKTLHGSNKFETGFTLNEDPKKKGSFNVSGQVVTHWLKKEKRESKKCYTFESTPFDVAKCKFCGDHYMNHPF